MLLLLSWLSLIVRAVLGVVLITGGVWVMRPIFYLAKEALMRTILAFSVLAVSACANIPGYPPAAAQNERCFYQTVREAFDGNFSNWALPDFVGGQHLRAGQIAPCMAKQG